MKEITNKTTAMKFLELRTGERVEDLLHKLYVEQGLSIREVGKELGVHYHTINSWLKLAGISMRLPQEKMLELIEIRRVLKCSNNK